MVHFVKGDQRACIHGCSVLVVVGRVVGEPVPLGLAWKGGEVESGCQPRQHIICMGWYGRA